MKKDSKIYIAGHKGLVGRAVHKLLQSRGYKNLIFKTHDELDLTDTIKVNRFFKHEKPEYVFLAAAKVGGIAANNKYRADFIYENLMIQANVIHQSYLHGIKKLLFLGSTCIYPKHCPQPIREEDLLTGSLEYTNEPYAIAKISGIKMCEAYNIQYGTNFLSVMPTNLYGPGDNFNLERSHVLPALLRKMYIGELLERNDITSLREHLERLPVSGVDPSENLQQIIKKLKNHGIRQVDGKIEVEIWGSGKPLRQFLYSEDMADACIYLMEEVNISDILAELNPGGMNKEIRNTHINIGSNHEISIKDLAYMVKDIIGFGGKLYFNTEKMDGTQRKVTDNSRIRSYGWRPKIDLTDGIKRLSEEMQIRYSLNLTT
jgi:GDP-L-fucose synthase